jgi:Zn-dependent membrane protease YugP
MYLIILIGSIVASLIAGQVLKSRFAKYAKIPLQTGLSGKEVAERMLRENNIHDVRVVSVPGRLTDHYNPMDRTVNLSPEVYDGRSISSAAVAAHECGHAVQHAQGYAWLKFRSAMVPVQQMSGTIINFVFIGMFFLGNIIFQAIPLDIVMLTIIACYAVFFLFSLVTLPVEFDASNRALVWLKTSRVATVEEKDLAYDALKWAATTYVVAALSALAMLLYWVMQYLGSRD